MTTIPKRRHKQHKFVNQVAAYNLAESDTDDSDSVPALPSLAARDSVSAPSNNTAVADVVDVDTVYAHDLDIDNNILLKAAPTQILRSFIEYTQHDTNQYILASVICSVALGVYMRTAYPSISGGDSGELVVTACNVGVAHPPGYPIFSMIAAVFAHLIPFGPSVAWRVHLFCATCGALAAGFMFLVIMKLTNNPFVAIGASLGYAFSSTVWLYSIQGEVFGLNNMLIAATLYALLSLARHVFRQCIANGADKRASGVLRRACIVAVLCGFCLSNQHTTVFYVFSTALVTLYLVWKSGRFSISSFCVLLTAGIVGLLPYAYLFIRARAQAMDSWGDQRTISGFIHHFLRREYGTFQLAADNTGNNPGLVARLWIYTDTFAQESFFVGPTLAVIGSVSLLYRGMKRSLSPWHLVVGISMFVGYWMYVLVFHHLANLDPSNPLFFGVQARFWMQANLYAFIWMACGFHWISSAVLGGVMSLFAGSTTASSSNRKRKKNKKKTKRTQVSVAKVSDNTQRSSISTLFFTLCIALPLVFAASEVAMNFHSRDFSDTTSFGAVARTQLEAFPRKSIVLLNGDLNNNIFKYAYQCENVRKSNPPRVHLLSLQLMTWDWFVPMQAHHYPGVLFPGGKYHPHEAAGFSMAQFLQANSDSYRIFICGPFKEGDQSHEALYTTRPFGMCDEIVLRKDETRKIAKFAKRSFKAMIGAADMAPFDPKKYTMDTWERVLYNDVWARQLHLSSYISFHANQQLSDKVLLETAKNATENLLQYEPDMRRYAMFADTMYRDCGIIFGQWSAAQMECCADEAEYYSTRLMDLWTEYIRRVPSDTQLSGFVKDRINPYTGKPVP
jgi:dolichyl-phosphate-mannose-protein mannosyltransferase